ncbi:hypothetical protein [Cytobacillus sp. IB215665]|uniref:hypothetical protein n=1 Tax=Cytobacillus sp. IB215665 TaxID=3097357 RepID=UPI002A0D8182|nr:hypothetical protein [Cytobacillus sp. IB215665]MDX8367709.1 hypothetical protein [Cytobacillus sp. IB215665]
MQPSPDYLVALASKIQEISDDCYQNEVKYELNELVESVYRTVQFLKVKKVD